MKLKRIINSLIITFVALFAGLSSVFAAGSATMSLTGNSSVVKGNNITLTISVDNISGSVDGKVSGIGGFINFDPEYLQYVSYAVVDTDNWGKSIKTANIATGSLGKFAAYDSSGETSKSGGIARVVFKALKSGSTTLSFSSAEASDKGANLLTVTTQNKTITITDPAPVLDSDSKLKSLGVTGYSLSPSFSSGTKAYTVSVPEGTESVTITAQCNSSKATLDQSSVGQKTLSGDTSTFTVKCTAENGTSSNYTITVNRAKHVEPEPEPEKKSSDSTLKSLSVSGYKYSPAFSPKTTTYNMTVANGITGLYVQAVPNDSKAKLEITGDSKWAVGKNTIEITVTAEDGSKTVYKVNVTRESEKKKSSDKNVDFRINNPHTITPNFSNDKDEYEVTVPNDITKLDLNVTPYDKNAKVSITGNEKFTTDGENIVKIKVTAEDGSTRTITLKVKRAEYKANTDLLDLRVKDYEMSPKFKASVTKYSVTVPYKVNSVKVIVKAPEGAKYTITGNKNLRTGKNVVLVKVTDAKDFVKYYQIDVTKEARKKFLGIGLIPFLILLFLLLILFLLLLLLLRRRKRKKEKRAALIAKESSDDDTVKQESPVHIDFKPEFNFNSKNGTDDDVVMSGTSMINGVDEKKLLDNQETIVDAKYDIYDDVVTKDELVDALNEGIRTKNVDKLQMLLDQENLNRKKKRMKRKAEESVENNYEPEHADNYDDYDEE